MAGFINERLIYEIVGKKVKQHREGGKLGKITQEDLAKAIGVTRVSVANYEAGKQAISLSDLYKIADYFHIDIEELLPHLEDVKLASPEERLEEAQSTGNLTDIEKEAIKKLLNTKLGGNDEG